MVSFGHYDGTAGDNEEGGPTIVGHVHRDLRRRDGRAGRAARRDGRLHGTGQVGAPGGAGHLPPHALDQRRDQRGRLRLPEAGEGRTRAVRAPARRRHDQGQHSHARTGAHGHRVGGLRRGPAGCGRRADRAGR